MTKLNWRDASKELPEKEQGIFQNLCIVRIQFIDGIGEKCRATVYDWYNETAEFDESIGSYVGKWAEHANDEVTHWIYAKDIPTPED